jgi:hypothetical protein
LPPSLISSTTFGRLLERARGLRVDQQRELAQQRHGRVLQLQRDGRDLELGAFGQRRQRSGSARRRERDGRPQRDRQERQQRLATSGGGTIQVGESTIAYNGTQVSGGWISFGNERLVGNPGTAPTAAGPASTDLGQK